MPTEEIIHYGSLNNFELISTDTYYISNEFYKLNPYYKIPLWPFVLGNKA